MAKPYGDALTAIVTLENAQPIGFVIDPHGGVIAVTGEHGSTTDEIVAFPHDGASITDLVSAPKGSISSVAADAASVYFVSSRTSVMRVARSGGASQIVATSPSCQITALASEAAGLYVATTKATSDSREVWFLPK